jgi:hypothetical protein
MVLTKLRWRVKKSKFFCSKYLSKRSIKRCKNHQRTSKYPLIFIYCTFRGHLYEQGPFIRDIKITKPLQTNIWWKNLRVSFSRWYVASSGHDQKIIFKLRLFKLYIHCNNYNSYLKVTLQIQNSSKFILERNLNWKVENFLLRYPYSVISYLYYLTLVIHNV